MTGIETREAFDTLNPNRMTCLDRQTDKYKIQIQANKLISAYPPHNNLGNPLSDTVSDVLIATTDIGSRTFTITDAHDHEQPGSRTHWVTNTLNHL